MRKYYERIVFPGVWVLMMLRYPAGTLCALQHTSAWLYRFAARLPQAGEGLGVSRGEYRQGFF